MSDIEVVTRFKGAAPIRSEAHRRFVRSVGCCVFGCRHARPLGRRMVNALVLGLLTQPPLVRWLEAFPPDEAMHPHHVRRAGTSGTAYKPGDEWCVGLCGALHHPGLHQRGELTCSRAWQIDLIQEAAEMAAAGRLLGFLPAIAA